MGQDAAAPNMGAELINRSGFSEEICLDELFTSGKGTDDLYGRLQLKNMALKCVELTA